MKSFIHTVIFFLCSYVTLMGVAYFFQRKLMYFPFKAHPSLELLKGVYQEVYTQTKDQLSLTHWYAKKGRPYIVVFHGNGGNIEGRGYRFKFLVDEGYSVLLVGYRGYGSNPGQPTETNLISDSILALEWLLKEEQISAKEIVLFGESLGSAVAITLAVQYPVKSLIFDGAFSSATEVGQSAYPFLPVRWLLKDTWDSESRIQKVNAPLLFIHSKKDTIIPFRFARKLFQVANEPKQHIWLDREDSGHNSNLEIESVRKSIIDFL
ncbi:MAG: alpha/beta hydrolase [Bdellovibrionales bacterium]|nr:alpha/beta hydrolase [Bdellovibrionales bacterium]